MRQTSIKECGEMDNELGLAEALEAARDELESAWHAGEGRPVRFRASQMTLSLSTVARLDKEGSGKIRWYLIEAGGGINSGSERAQTLTLTLEPVHVDAQGRSGSLEVSSSQSEPGL
jgi:Trypsin-co-occurring domain 2